MGETLRASPRSEVRQKSERRGALDPSLRLKNGCAQDDAARSRTPSDTYLRITSEGTTYSLSGPNFFFSA